MSPVISNPAQTRLRWLACATLALGFGLAACGEEEDEPDQPPDTASGDTGVELNPDDCRLDASVDIVGGKVQGLEKYCEIAGNVNIVRNHGDPKITDDDIQELRNVKLIQGVLYVSDTHLESLDGLRNLEHVLGDVIIDSNAELPNLYGLQKLRKIGGALAVLQHAVMTDLDDLTAIEQIGTGIKIEDNLNLQRFTSLQFITAVSHSVSIRRNPKLKDIKGLTTLRNAGSEGLFIENNNMLRYDHGVEMLENAGKLLLIKNNNNLQLITKFQSLSSVGRIEITGNTSLERIDAFNKLGVVDDVVLRDNKSLEQVKGFANLPMMRNIEIKLSKSLQSMTGFANVTVAQDVVFEANPTLTQVRFDHLATVNKLTLIDNGAFPDFGGFLPLKNIALLKICNNPQLTPKEVEDFVKSRHPPKPKVEYCD